MYCPKCSQQQSSEEVRFCSRCGFQLGVVKELLAQTEAHAVTGVEPVAPVPSRGLSRRDVTVGALLMFVVGLIVVLVPGTTPPPVREAQLLMLVGMFIALTLLVNFIRPLLRAANKLFGEEDAAPLPAPAPDLTTRVSPAAHRAALPPTRAFPAAASTSPRVNTAEMLRRPSVTEHTTNLLDNK
jgi:hypothetical protein